MKRTSNKFGDMSPFEPAPFTGTYYHRGLPIVFGNGWTAYEGMWHVVWREKNIHGDPIWMVSKASNDYASALSHGADLAGIFGADRVDMVLVTKEMRG